VIEEIKTPVEAASEALEAKKPVSGVVKADSNGNKVLMNYGSFNGNAWLNKEGDLIPPPAALSCFVERFSGLG